MKKIIALEKPIILYGPKGEILSSYTLDIEGEVLKDRKGNDVIKSQEEWIRYYAGLGTQLLNRRLVTLTEIYAVIEQWEGTKNPALDGMVDDLRKSDLCTGTQFGYHNNHALITHLGDSDPFNIPCTIPEESGYLDDLIKHDEWQTVVQGALLCKEVDKAVELLHSVSGKRPYITTPIAKSRKSCSKRAAELFINDKFYLNCDSSPNGHCGCSRGVRKKSSNDLISAQRSDSSTDFLRRGADVNEQVIELPTREKILLMLKPYIADPLWKRTTTIIPEKAPVLGDIVQRLTDEKLLAIHSREPCINVLQAMFPKYNKK